MKADLPIIVITGPSASGKTTLAIQLAKEIDAEIIYADSRAVYIDFNIVSAKPTFEEQKGIKHHLLDVFSPSEKFSAGDFVTLATCAIDDIKKRGKNVIICGGTWFYINALLGEKMLPEIPSDENLRNKLINQTNEELWKKLKKLDFKRAEEVNQNNREKVIRSIEMCLALNSPISEFKRKENKKFNSLWFMRDIEREELYKRINERVDLMIKDGLKQEFDCVVQKYGVQNENILSTIGYKEFIEFKDKNEAIDKIKQHTRNFAKRQMTYFRGNGLLKIASSKNSILNEICL